MPAVDTQKPPRKKAVRKKSPKPVAGDRPADLQGDMERAAAFKRTPGYVKTVQDARGPDAAEEDSEYFRTHLRVARPRVVRAKPGQKASKPAKPVGEADKPRTLSELRRFLGDGVRPRGVQRSGPPEPRGRVGAGNADQMDRTRTPAQKAHDKKVSDENIRAAREKDARALPGGRPEFVKASKKDLGDWSHALKQALSGKGPIPEAAGRLAHKIVGGLGGAGGPQLATIPGTSTRLPGAPTIKVAGKVAEDLINFPAQVVPSVYVPVAGAYEAAKGHPERLKELAKNIDATDPVYNTVAAGVDIVKGDKKSAKKRLDAAGKAASEHPGYTVLEVVGAKGAIGRGAGRVMRRIPGTKKLASTERAPLTLPGTSLKQPRTYSPDVITKAGQVAADKVRGKVAKKMKAHADKVEPVNPSDAAAWRRGAEVVHPTHIRETEIQRRVDEHVDAQETVRRMHRGETVNETRALVKPVEGAGPITSLVAQGIVRADVADVRAYIAELTGEYARTGAGALGRAQKRANKDLRHGLEKAVTKAEHGKVDLSAVKAVAEKYREGQAVRETELADREMLPPDQAAKAAAIPYAVRRMGAKHEPEHWVDGAGKAVPESVVRQQRAADPKLAAALYTKIPPRTVDAHGAPLSLSQIHAHMRNHGEVVPSYLSQAPNARGARNFFVSSSRAPGIDGHVRTGEATRGGTFDAHPDTLTEQAARQTGLADAFDGFHAFLDEFALKGDKGKITTLHTRAQVEDAIRNAMYDAHGEPRPGAVKFAAVRVNPFSGRAEQLEKMLEGTDSAVLEARGGLQDAVHDALDGKGGDGPWALVPEAAAKRMQEHVRVLNPGNAGKVAQKVSGTFRKTVLSTSIPWLVGNTVEGVTRAGLARAGPRSYVTGRRVLKRAVEIDKNAGERLTARTVGGGHFGSAERQQIHMNIDAMNPGVIRGVSRGLGAFWRTPGPKQAAGAWHAYTHAVFNTVNRFAEQQVQTAMLGKAIRDSHLMDGDLRMLSEKAIDQAAHGAVDVNTAAELGRAVDRMYGKYGKWSPDMRKAVALYTPFVAWTLNAGYFVVRTLPRDHPVALLMTAMLENATDEWRKEHGLDQFIKGHAPGWLQGSIPLPGGGHLRAPQRYLPSGAFGDPLETATGALLPQLMGMWQAGHGKDWQGNDLKDQSTAGKALAMGRSFIESTIPGLSTGERIVTKGPKVALLDATLGVVPKQKRRKVRPRKPPARDPMWGGDSSGSVWG